MGDRRSYWQAADGTKSIDLNAADAGMISQSFATTVGNTYTVTFALSGNPDGGPAAKMLRVSATGGAPIDFSFDTGAAGNSRTDMKWSTRTYSFVATSATSTFTFTSTTAGAYGPALDNVRVAETAAPGPVATKQSCKKGGWKQLTDSAGHRFRNQGDCVSYFATGGRNLAAGSR